MIKGTKVLLAALGLLAAGAMQSWAVPVTYNAASEFNKLQGGTTLVWNYGKLDGAGGAFSLGAIDGDNFRGPGAGGYPYVGADYMHPGCSDAGGGTCQLDKAFANLRFTAPTAGIYTATFQVRLSDLLNNPFKCEYRGCDQPGRADWRRDGVRMWLGSDYKDLSMWGGGTDPLADAFAGKTLTQTFTLSAGQFIDFSVDHNGARECALCTPSPNRFNLYDSTRYVATVTTQTVPEPSSALLMAAGLFSLGWVRARRRRAQDQRN
jgi:hypothetical protein